LGSQTIGSTIRPAAYCGIVGFKGTYGRITTEGVTPLAWSLDHVGIFARAVDDIARLFQALADEPDAVPGAAQAAGSQAGTTSLRPRFGVPDAWISAVAGAEVQAHLGDVIALLRDAGAYVGTIALPPTAARIEADGRLILRVEAAAYHSRWFPQHAAEYGPRIRELVESGLSVTATAYIHAHETRYAFRREMNTIFRDHDALLLPAAPSTAPPASEGTTGDPVFCAPWTFAGLPAIALPSGLSPAGLPLATQLVGPVAADARLLEIARWCEERFRFGAVPPL
jgi:Asp-tRNA(Asn)/Glu-tRNA(Gln) amidotransferase A subunit family amidase